MNPSDIRFSDRDEFKRVAIAKKLVKLLSSDVPLTSIVIDGAWGTGKSEFCQKFVNHAIDSAAPFKCVYIDAFKFDHSDDPFAMLIGAISALIQNKSEKEDLLNKAVPVAKVLSKTAGRAFVGWVFKTSAETLGNELYDALKEGAEEALDEGIKRVFEEFEEAEHNLKLYKNTLSSIANKQRIVIVIDELDRCRPYFALMILEKIKHVFDVPNIRFVLATNTDQLAAMVKKLYGTEIDAKTYLSKFFSFTLPLSSRHQDDSRLHRDNTFEHFLNLVRADENFRSHFNDRSSIFKFIKALLMREFRSLRDAEMFHRNLLILNSISDRPVVGVNSHWSYVAIVLFSVYLHSFYLNLARDITDEKFSSESVGTILGTSIEALKTSSHLELEGFIFAIIKSDLDYPAFKEEVGEAHANLLNREIGRILDPRNDPGHTRRLDLLKTCLRELQFG